MKFLSILIAAAVLLPCFSPNAEARHRRPVVVVKETYYKPYYGRHNPHYGYYHRYGHHYPQYHRRSGVSISVGTRHSRSGVYLGY